MKIQVWKRYTENRASEPIEEGIYEQSDPKLFGLARYLIDNGNARIYVEPPQVIEIDPQVLVESVVKSFDESLLVDAETPETIGPIFDEEEVTIKPKRTRKAKS